MTSPDWLVADAETRQETRLNSRSYPTLGSPVQQGFRELAEPYRIAERFGAGVAPPVAPYDPSRYGDFDMGMDLREAFDRVSRARQAFAQLPAELRHRFGHHPAGVLDFLADPANLDEARRLGLAPPAPPSATPDNSPSA